jgi:hypothetical protein
MNPLGKLPKQTMANTLPKALTKSDPRYFIWAIVFLIVSGVSLVSYILITGMYEETELNNTILSIPHRTKK